MELSPISISEFPTGPAPCPAVPCPACLHSDKTSHFSVSVGTRNGPRSWLQEAATSANFRPVAGALFPESQAIVLLESGHPVGILGFSWFGTTLSKRATRLRTESKTRTPRTWRADKTSQESISIKSWPVQHGYLGAFKLTPCSPLPPPARSRPRQTSQDLDECQVPVSVSSIYMKLYSVLDGSAVTLLGEETVASPIDPPQRILAVTLVGINFGGNRSWVNAEAKQT